MSLHRRAAKRDLTEPEVTAEWDLLGAVAESFAKKGWPDWVVFHDGKTYWADVKGATGGLTPAQVETFTRLYLLGIRVHLPRSRIDARRMLEGTLQPWSPSQGQLATVGAVVKNRAEAKAAKAARKHVPGKSRMRTVEERCREDFCATSHAPGSLYCIKHGKADAVPPPRKRTP
jgi:hypothetical protein